MLNERECYLCGHTGYLHVHHLMNGQNRRLADEDGLTIYVCPRCHEQIHADAGLRRELKALAQHHYLETHTFEEWMKRYGRNYLKEIN